MKTKTLATQWALICPMSTQKQSHYIMFQAVSWWVALTYLGLVSEVYSEPCKTFKMEFFAKIVNRFQSLIIFAQRIFGFWQGSEYSLAYGVNKRAVNLLSIKKQDTIKLTKNKLKMWIYKMWKINRPLEQPQDYFIAIGVTASLKLVSKCSFLNCYQ